MQLTDAQQQAINHTDGPMLVLAGPGSGKTMVITRRIEALIHKAGVSPKSILVITFSKAATQEMQQRFSRLCPQEKDVRFGTFHSLFYEILRAAYGRLEVVSEQERLGYISHALIRQNEDPNECLTECEREISKVKGSHTDISYYYSPNFAGEQFRKIYESYQEQLRLANKIDFDDMATYVHDLFTQRKDILTLWQKRYPYLLIDEFQDINRLQYENICLLTGKRQNIFIVGDDDQSIYGFRGADPHIMLNFPKDFPTYQKVTLSRNFRSGLTIQKVTHRVIEHNNGRFDKELDLTKVNEDEPVYVSCYANLITQAEGLIKKIRDYQANGIAYEQMAILFRTNAQSRMIARKCSDFNVPFSLNEKVPGLLNHFITKDFLSYIRIACDERRREHFLRVANRPRRYLSRQLFDTPLIDWNRIKLYLEDKDWMVDRVEQWQFQSQRLSKMQPYAGLKFIRQNIGYDSFLREYAEEKHISYDELLEVAQELTLMAKECQTYDEWYALLERQDQMLMENTKVATGIQLMTFHASKGLEFSVVFIPDANEDIVPYKRSVNEGNLEEERRLFYVGMTRAKRYLHVTYVKERLNKKSKPSLFLSEMGVKGRK